MMGIYEKKVNTLILRTQFQWTVIFYNTAWKRFYSETCLSGIFCNVSPECILDFLVLCQVKMFYTILKNFMELPYADLVFVVQMLTLH